LADLYYLQNNYKKSLKHYTFIVENFKNNHNIYEYIAYIYLILNKENKADNMISLISKNKSVFIENSYSFQDETEINNINNGYEVIKTKIEWSVDDPILYDFVFETKKSAEKYIYDILYAYLLPEFKLDKNNFFSNSGYKKIITQCNDSNHLKKVGIEILSIDVNVTKKEETNQSCLALPQFLSFPKIPFYFRKSCIMGRLCGVAEQSARLTEMLRGQGSQLWRRLSASATMRLVNSSPTTTASLQPATATTPSVAERTAQLTTAPFS